MSWRDRIILDPLILAGKPVVRGTRLAVEFIVGLLAQGWTEHDLLANYPGLERADVLACLSYLARCSRAKRCIHWQSDVRLRAPGARVSDRDHVISHERHP